MEKKILDPCCGSRMFYFDKEDPRVVFGDIRIFEGLCCDGRKIKINPDVSTDFTQLDFPDNSFHLVIFDPPHLIRVGDNAWLKQKYGSLPKKSWKETLKKGFKECWRVLEPGGTLIFKWNESQIKLTKIKDLFPDKPVIGTRTNTNTMFIVFYKTKNSSV